MFILLSYPLATGIPVPGRRQALSIQADESIERGNLGNTFYFTVWNHAGTHVDAPGHMLRGAKVITDLEADQFVFDHPCVVDMPKEESELISSEDLLPFEDAIARCDLLLLRTGFTRYRDNDPLRYQDRNPGLSVSVARYLSGDRFPLLRAIGIDSISMAAAAHVLEGVEAHKILFKKDSRQTMLLIEDLDLGKDLTNLKRVIVAPLFIRGLDSSPCTVLAEIAANPG
jgi:arylformamidase